MKNLHKTRTARNTERGAIAIVIAAMWMTLFGIAALAVDFGYLYTRQRGLQAVSDAAVTAAMPIYRDSGTAPARTRALAVASANGYTTSGNTVVDANEVAANSQFRVRVSRVFPTFFGGLFGISQKQIVATSIGRLDPGSGVAAIHTNSASCADFGFTVQGNTPLNIVGNVESNGVLSIGWLNASCYPAPSAICRISGTARAPCPGNPQNPSSFTVSGGIANVGGFPDPFAATTLATLTPLCTGGTNTATPLGGLPWNPEAGGCNSLPPGVYCSSADINVSPPGPGMSICAPGVTFVSAGAVIIGANNNITLSAAAGVPNNLIVFAGGSGGGPTINMGSAGTYTMTGSFYAPLGHINGGGGNVGGFQLAGSIVGYTIFLGMDPGGTWNITGGGGPSGSGWSLYQ
jgi:hypothetical protein